MGVDEYQHLGWNQGESGTNEGLFVERIKAGKWNTREGNALEPTAGDIVSPSFQNNKIESLRQHFGGGQAKAWSKPTVVEVVKTARI